MPACLEVCPVGARKFGDLNDPDSEVSQILNNKHIFVLKQEVGTRPRFFYYYDQEYPRSKRVSLAVPKGWDFDSPGSTGGGIA
jgi:Fe-S-cluster-containing dehydrogenase component